MSMAALIAVLISLIQVCFHFAWKHAFKMVKYLFLGNFKHFTKCLYTVGMPLYLVLYEVKLQTVQKAT